MPEETKTPEQTALEKRRAALIAVFRETVLGQVNNNRQHGWGAADSKAVIEAVISEDAEIGIKALVAAKKAPETYTPSDFAMELVERVINPSAYRQVLEKEKRPDGQTVLAPSAKKATEKAVFSLYS